ncbi:MAG: integrase [Hymenobacter sp.]|nr:integrase [Hymenobacter sp.]
MFTYRMLNVVLGPARKQAVYFLAYPLHGKCIGADSCLAGADNSEVMNQTKHKTSEMIRRYTRLDNVRQHNATQKLGL